MIGRLPASLGVSGKDGRQIQVVPHHIAHEVSLVPFEHEVSDRRGKQHLLIRLPRAESLVTHELFFGPLGVCLQFRPQSAVC